MRGKAIAVLVVLSLPVFAQHGSTTAVNPYTSPEDEAAGAKLYRSQCAGCHGLNGGGTGAGPSLTSGTFQRGGSDEALFRTISKGIPGTPMPAFSFSGLKIWQLVTHLRELGIVRGSLPVKGDLAAGAALFKSNCAGCHAVQGEGGLRGPDLTLIGSGRSYAELRTAILDPDAEVSPEHWSVIVKTSAGQTIRGTRLNEDTHSLQLRDQQGRLLSLRKKDLSDYQLVRRSPMPSFTGKLSDTQIADVLAYLVSLRGEP